MAQKKQCLNCLYYAQVQWTPPVERTIIRHLCVFRYVGDEEKHCELWEKNPYAMKVLK